MTLRFARRRKLAIEGIQTMKPTVIAAAIFTALIDLVSAANLDTARIDQLTGLKGKLNEKEGVYKVTFPRNDVKVGRGRMDDAAVHGPWNVGRIHRDQRWSNGDGRYGSV